MKRFFECLVPTTACNIKCSYCYIIQENRRKNEKALFLYTPQHIGKALSLERLGGVSFISMTAAGETLLPVEIPEITYEILKQGHFVNITTNGTISKRFDEILNFDKDPLSKLHFSFSFHYLELLRTNRITAFFENIRKVRRAGCSFILQINLCDEYIPYWEDIKQISLHETGALTQVALTRDESYVGSGGEFRILTKNIENYQKIGNEMNSPLFDFTCKNFMVKRKEMTYQEKISELKNIIQKELTPLITDNYVLLDLPYHTNIGDFLIWEGVKAFLKTTPYKCLYTSSVDTYNTQYKIPKNAIILINGGSSFDDLWRRHPEFWLSTIQKHLDNKIIILPQSIFYKNEKSLEEDAKIFSKYKKLTICLRDNNSLSIANQYFANSNNILVPDMAFYIDMTKWKKYISASSNKVLFLSRKDSERKLNQSYNIVPVNAEVHDWPTMEYTPPFLKRFYKVQYFLQRVDGKLSTNFSNSFTDIAYKNTLKKNFIKEGIKFTSSYSEIYITRLHSAILSILFQKSFIWFDNSYGKSSSFYDTWLSDIKSIKFIKFIRE